MFIVIRLHYHAEHKMWPIVTDVVWSVCVCWSLAWAELKLLNWRCSASCSSGHFGNIPYDEARRTCNILLLVELRHELGKRFFQRIIKDKSNVLFYLLPAKCDVQLMTRLCRARQYPTIYAWTNRYKNFFILFGLNHFQWCDFVYAWFSCMFNPAFRGCQNPINGLWTDPDANWDMDSGKAKEPCVRWRPESPGEGAVFLGGEAFSNSSQSILNIQWAVDIINLIR